MIWKNESARKRWEEIQAWAEENMAEFVSGENESLNKKWSEMRAEANGLVDSYRINKWEM